MSRQRFFSLKLRHEFSVVIRFGAGSGLGRDKGLLMSLQSFPRGGTFLSRQKFQGWCCDKMFFCRDP